MYLWHNRETSHMDVVVEGSGHMIVIEYRQRFSVYLKHFDWPN